jgi:hypothetical protein
MRTGFTNMLLAASAAAALVSGITIASAQGPSGGGMQGGHQIGGTGGHRMEGGGAAPMHQGPSGGGGGSAPLRQGPSGGGFSGGVPGGGHAPNFGQARPGGQFGHMPEQRGHAFSEDRGRALMEQPGVHGQNRGISGRTGTPPGEWRGPRHAFGEERSRGFGETRGVHGQNLGTTSRTGTHGFAQAGTQSRISLSTQQRTRIQNVVLHRGFISRFRVSNVDFDVDVGVRVPRRFHLFVIPEDIVLIEPEFSGYLCFVYDDELVIVDSVTYMIVAVIPV